MMDLRLNSFSNKVEPPVEFYGFDQYPAASGMLGLLGGLVLMAAIAWRAVREERTLRAELPGYAEYMQRVRYRLIPYIW
jgi:hypothetical protein